MIELTVRLLTPCHTTKTQNLFCVASMSSCCTPNARRYYHLWYWPLAARSTLRGVFRKCIQCNRAEPKDTGYQMGQLPASKMQVQASFFSTGVNYARQFFIKERTRSKSITKAYLYIFMCLATSGQRSTCK